jgi:hypothetical protein
LSEWAGFGVNGDDAKVPLEQEERSGHGAACVDISIKHREKQLDGVRTTRLPFCTNVVY